MDSGGCPICNTHLETSEHLFLGCDFSTILWRNIPWPLFSLSHAERPMADWFKLLLNSDNMPVQFQEQWPLLMLAVAIVFDTIWYARNELVHERKTPDVAEAIQTIQRRYYEHEEAWSYREQIQLIWQPPSAGNLKINFDVAVGSNGSSL